MNYFFFFHDRSAPKETRDKANLMTAEKKLRQELEESRNEVKKLQNYVKTLRKKPGEDEVNFLEKIERKFNSILFFNY